MLQPQKPYEFKGCFIIIVKDHMNSHAFLNLMIEHPMNSYGFEVATHVLPTVLPVGSFTCFCYLSVKTVVRLMCLVFVNFYSEKKCRVSSPKECCLAFEGIL